MGPELEAERPVVRAGPITSWAVAGIPEVTRGQDLGRLAVDSLVSSGGLQPWDVVVVTHKIVSKAEGRVYPLSEFEPRPEAVALAEELGQEPQMVEAVLRESRRVIRAESGVLITETP
ncbi:MAG: coenzyme F420-0:L-glutamate ligase, partial [Candidatus Dormiibacterota bacterium]